MGRNIDMTAQDILTFNSSGAPQEWKNIPEIAAAKPKKTGGIVDISLQRIDIDGVDLCVWEVQGRNCFWTPVGPVFIVKP